MADEPAGRTSLGVLHEILNNLGDSNQYHYVVEALEALKNLLGEGGIGEAVSDWLEAHPEASTTVQNGSITLLKLANDVKSAINGKAESSDLQTLADNLEALAQTVAEKADASDLDDKADIDGYYSQLTAGLAENLIGRGDAVPAEYLYRTAGGDADIEDGIATVSCIKGNTLVWNQMNQNNGASNSTGLTRTFNSDGSVTIDGTSNATGEFVIGDSVQVYKDHKYLVKGCPAGGSSATYYIGISVFVVDTGAGGIWTAGSNAVSHFKFVVKSEQTFNNVSFYPQLFDLTLMFGAGNEPATVEEFEAMFPLPYYPYSAPKLLPVDIRGVETVGFNLWDEELEVGVYNSTTGAKSVSTDYVRSANKIHVFPNTTYCFNVVDKSVTVYFYTYDESGAYRQTSIGISSGGTFVVPNGIHYFAFALKVSQYGSTTYQNDICINLSWSGYRNGEYEEHWSAERPIDTSRFFPTGLKKVGDKADALYADHYDTVIGAVDLGTLTWAVNNTYGYYTEGIKAIIKKPVDTYHAINMVCVGRTVGTFAQLSSGGRSTDLIAVYTDGALCFSSDIATEADFKAAMSGVILYYELATPTTTEIDPPLNLSYKVSDFGTERIMVDETADAPQTAPVPMEVEYGINAIDTIRRLPTEYQSHKSMGQLTAALESSLGIDITETWDEDDQRYEYEISDFELADDAVTPNSLSDEVLHGQYPSLSVGRADALTGADSTAQWATRVTAGSGAATVRNVQGAAVAFMQWAKPISATNWEINYAVEGSTLTFDGEIATITYGRENQSQALEWVLGLASRPNADVPITTGHKFLIAFDYKPSQANNVVTLGVNQAQTQFATNGTPDEWNHYANIVQQSNTAVSVISFRFAVGYRNITVAAGLTIQYKNPQVYDLTTMFGAGSEPSTVAEFESMYPVDYYPYSEPTLKPVRIAGITSTDAQGASLDSIEIPVSTYFPNGMYGLSDARDELTATEAITRVGLLDLGVVTWVKGSALQDGTGQVFYCNAGTYGNFIGALLDAPLTKVPFTTWETLTKGQYMTSNGNVIIGGDSALSAADFKASMSGVMCAYALKEENITTTPISPALAMTYRVEQGGSESIIVPAGEVSAAPVLTIAEGESAAELVMDALACIAAPDGPVATANHALNTYLTMGGKLYKVTRVIAVGETIAAGTNVTQTTVMDELIALTA